MPSARMKRGGPNVPFIGSGHFGTQDDVSPDGQTVYFVNRTPMPATTDVNIVVGWRAFLK